MSQLGPTGHGANNKMGWRVGRVMSQENIVEEGVLHSYWERPRDKDTLGHVFRKALQHRCVVPHIVCTQVLLALIKNDARHLSATLGAEKPVTGEGGKTAIATMERTFLLTLRTMQTLHSHMLKRADWWPPVLGRWLLSIALR
jgi:hypothetical protein